MCDSQRPAQATEHPAFTRARAVEGFLKGHFPTTPEEARVWVPTTVRHELAMRVLAVAKTRVECAWAAYIDAVPGWNHDREQAEVLEHGDKLREDIARVLFPMFKDVPYAH